MPAKLPDLKELGPRVAIIGPSSSGKSTLAVVLAEKLDAELCHLDQIAHIPGTNWERRPDQEFIALHDRIIEKESWVIEGNYSICMPQRFARATSVIWLDPPLPGCIFRYIKRCLLDNGDRPGKLENAAQEFSFKLIKFTLFTYPKNRKKYKNILARYPDLKVFVFRRLLPRRGKKPAIDH